MKYQIYVNMFARDPGELVVGAYYVPEGAAEEAKSAVEERNRTYLGTLYACDNGDGKPLVGMMNLLEETKS